MLYTIDCEMPAAPTSGDVNTEIGTGYKDYASYTCESGTKLVGTNVRQCMSNGLWEDKAPICQPIGKFAILTIFGNRGLSWIEG